MAIPRENPMTPDNQTDPIICDPHTVFVDAVRHSPWGDEADARRFVAAKEACWARDGLGHWAVFADGRYVGWGGFQKEGEEWDFGLVLRPDAFGLGPVITRSALDFARTDPRISAVTFLLPLTRRHLGALARMGAHPMGEVEHAGAAFRKYRVELDRMAR